MKSEDQAVVLEALADLWVRAGNYFSADEEEWREIQANAGAIRKVARAIRDGKDILGLGLN